MSEAGFMTEDDGKSPESPILIGLRALQHEILEAVARGRPLPSVMDDLCRGVETLAPDVICSILAVDHLGLLRPLAASGLPEHYSAALDGLAIGPKVGSCGTAAFRGEPVEVVDIANDPLWADYKSLALPLGLRACWSSPIQASSGRVIGAFAFYYRTCRGASPLDHAIVKTCVHLCAIALEQEERTRRIHQLAYFDSLTGLPNRVSLQERGSAALAEALQQDAGFSIHCIDLDGFKKVNDTLGHGAGDMLLAGVARRFSACLASGEIIARIGGDEFAVLQPSTSCDAEIHALARRLIAASRDPFDVDGFAVAIGVSVGIARAPRDGRDFGDLMKKADLALYHAKSNGRAQYQLFESSIGQRLLARHQIEQDLKQALAQQEFELHYQPMVDLDSIRISGVEALIRWRHPQRGLMPPMDFIPLAEETGLITDLGDWVLREACARAACFPQGVRIAVNLSPMQLRKPGFALTVLKAIETAHLPPERLELEITETALLTEDAAALACLRDLRSLGVSIALDDFGTGYSTLSRLLAFPIDRIKIDRSFVQELGAKGESASIIQAVVGLARDLSIKVTAEGVETNLQLRQLHGLGCDEVQGYLLSKPKPLSDLLDFFEQPSNHGFSKPPTRAAVGAN